MKKVFKVACGGECVLEGNNDEYSLFIGDNVKEVNDINKSTVGELTTALKELRGNLKVVGGKNLENGYGLFMECRFDELDLREFNAPKLKDATLMFGYTKIKELIFGSFDMANVEIAQQMFNYSKIDRMDVSKFKTTNLKDMKTMFFRCSTKVLDLSNWDFSSMERCNWMLKGCTAVIKCNNKEILGTKNGDLKDLVG